MTGAYVASLSPQQKLEKTQLELRHLGQELEVSTSDHEVGCYPTRAITCMNRVATDGLFYAKKHLDQSDGPFAVELSQATGIFLRHPHLRPDALEKWHHLVHNHHQILRENPLFLFWMASMENDWCKVLRNVYFENRLIQQLLLQVPRERETVQILRDVMQEHMVSRMRRADGITPYPALPTGIDGAMNISAWDQEVIAWGEAGVQRVASRSTIASSWILGVLEFSSPTWRENFENIAHRLWLQPRYGEPTNILPALPFGHLFLSDYLMPYLQLLHDLGRAFNVPVPSHLLDVFVTDSHSR